MSEDDVYPGEMDAPHEFDDEAAEALLSGSGRGIDPQIDDLFDDMRVAYASQPPAVGAELAAVLAEAEVTAEAPPARRFERMRSSIVAKAGAAAAAVVAATGGLAVAHALPDSMQDAASHIGVGAPAHRGQSGDVRLEVRPDDPTTTTIEATSTTVPDGENDAVERGDDNDQGAVVGSHEGDNDDQGENECEADERGELEQDDDTTPTTVACTPTTETTVPESHDGNVGDDPEVENEHPTVSTVPESHDGENGTSDSSGPGSGDEQHTTPTTASHSGGDSGSRDGGGSSNDG